MLVHSRPLVATARGWASGCLLKPEVAFARALEPAAGQTLRQASWSGTVRRLRLVDSTPCRFEASEVADKMSSTASRSFWDTPQGTGTPWMAGGGGPARMARQQRCTQLRAAHMAPTAGQHGRHAAARPAITECRPIKSCFRDTCRMKRTSASRNARHAHCTLGDAKSLQHRKFTPVFRKNETAKRHSGGEHSGADALFNARSRARRAALPPELRCRHASCSPPH